MRGLDGNMIFHPMYLAGISIATRRTDMANAARKARRQLSWNRCHGPNGKKDMNVFKSSHGKFSNVAELETHRRKVTKNG